MYFSVACKFIIYGYTNLSREFQSFQAAVQVIVLVIIFFFIFNSNMKFNIGHFIATSFIALSVHRH